MSKIENRQQTTTAEKPGKAATIRRGVLENAGTAGIPASEGYPKGNWTWTNEDRIRLGTRVPGC